MAKSDQGGWHSDNPVEPGAGDWEMVETPEAEEYRVPRPPGNRSEETRREIEELHAMAANRTPEDIEQIYKWSKNEPSVMTHWGAFCEELIKQYGLTPPAGARIHALLNQAVYCSMIACWHQKYRLLRPRPSDLDPTLDVSVIPVPQHPAYPSGHSTVAGAAAAVLAHFFPADSVRCHALAEESGISRLKAGIHFRSDHSAGLELGRRVARDILAEAAEDGGPQHY